MAPGALHTQVFPSLLRDALLPQMTGVAVDAQAPFFGAWPDGQIHEYLPEPWFLVQAAPEAAHVQDWLSLARDAPSPQPQLLSEDWNVAPGALQTHFPLESGAALLPQLGEAPVQAPFLIVWPEGHVQEYLPPLPLAQVAPVAEHLQVLLSALSVAPSPQLHDLSVPKVAPGALHTQELVVVSRVAAFPQSTGPVQTPFLGDWPEGQLQVYFPLESVVQDRGARHWHAFPLVLRVAPEQLQDLSVLKTAPGALHLHLPVPSSAAFLPQSSVVCPVQAPFLMI